MFLSVAYMAFISYMVCIASMAWTTTILQVCAKFRIKTKFEIIERIKFVMYLYQKKKNRNCVIISWLLLQITQKPNPFFCTSDLWTVVRTNFSVYWRGHKKIRRKKWWYQGRNELEMQPREQKSHMRHHHLRLLISIPF